MKYLISIIAAIGVFCALIILLLNNGVEPSLTLSCILALFSWVIGFVVFLKLSDIERKLDEEDKSDEDIQANVRARKSFRNNNQ
jgi:hypothetical protein